MESKKIALLSLVFQAEQCKKGVLDGIIDAQNLLEQNDTSIEGKFRRFHADFKNVLVREIRTRFFPSRDFSTHTENAIRKMLFGDMKEFLKKQLFNGLDIGEGAFISQDIFLDIESYPEFLDEESELEFKGKVEGFINGKVRSGETFADRLKGKIKTGGEFMGAYHEWHKYHVPEDFEPGIKGREDDYIERYVCDENYDWLEPSILKLFEAAFNEEGSAAAEHPPPLPSPGGTPPPPAPLT
jgi:hypothetical protein